MHSGCGLNAVRSSRVSLEAQICAVELQIVPWSPDCSPDGGIAAWRHRLQPGGSDCSLKAWIAAWNFSLEAQMGACRLRKLSALCRPVASEALKVVRAVPASDIRIPAPLTVPHLDIFTISLWQRSQIGLLAGFLAGWLKGKLGP